MNNDLISRSKVIEELNYLKHIGYDNSGVMKLQNMEIQRCISVIEDAPAVELFCSYLSDGEVRQPCVEGPCEQERLQGDVISRNLAIAYAKSGLIRRNGGENWIRVSEVVQSLKDVPTTERPKGEREFIEILTQYVPDDICTYPEYRGKPYYSIHYRENGENFVGYGTYKIEVLSRWLKEDFFNVDMRGEEE